MNHNYTPMPTLPDGTLPCQLPPAANVAVRLVGTAAVLPVRDCFFDRSTLTLTIGVDLPKGYGPTQDEPQAPYSTETAPGLATPDLVALARHDLAAALAAAAKLPDDDERGEPLYIKGQGNWEVRKYA